MNEKTSKKSESAIQCPRGTRDFYPDLMAREQWLFRHWRKTSLLHGFEEYDGPIFEHLDLYQIKSGDEIVSQLFNFEDRGGRRLAIRPELTPTLARMIAVKANSLPRPVRWFSIPRLCRAERPQQGRLREFYQWNIDVIGLDDVLADAECMFVALDFCRRIGLDSTHIELCVNSRPIVSALLVQEGISSERHDAMFAIMDKFQKLSESEFVSYCHEQKISDLEIDTLKRILNVPSLEALSGLCASESASAELKKIQDVKGYLDCFGVGDYFVYKPTIVRGLAYYTGIVWEMFDRGESMRAIAGGGRYDNLISMFGGPAMSACGFGMGDVVLFNLLDELGKVPEMTSYRPPEYFVIDAEADIFPKVLEIAARLRQKNIGCEYSAKRQAVGKQLKSAAGRKAKFAVILGEETRTNNQISVKDLSTGEQKQIDLDSFMQQVFSDSQ